MNSSSAFEIDAAPHGDIMKSNGSSPSSESIIETSGLPAPPVMRVIVGDNAGRQHLAADDAEQSDMISKLPSIPACAR